MRAYDDGCLRSSAGHDRIGDAGLNHGLRDSADRANNPVAGDGDTLAWAYIYTLRLCAGVCGNVQGRYSDYAGIDNHFGCVRRNLDVKIRADYTQRGVGSIGLKF